MHPIEQPLVSIAICTYNGERFLKKQIDGLLAQDYTNIEIVAVDDQSSDNTWAMLQEYAQKDKRVQAYQNEKNLGYARNFEKAITLCKGDFIALADQDDIWESKKIGTVMASIGDAILVYHDSDFIDEQDQRIGDNTMASRFRMYDGDSTLPFLLSNCISGHAALFSKKLVEFILPFNDAKYHDWWIAYVAFNVGKVKFVDEVLVHYRQHQTSITDTLQRRDENAVPKKLKGLDRLSVDEKWLGYCANFKYNKEPALINEATALFINLTRGKGRLQCMAFMMKYFDLLFYIITNKQKGFTSRLNFVRKLCFS
jgi:glycosyltransferase involved in cell wall biosynthesis